MVAESNLDMLLDLEIESFRHLAADTEDPDVAEGDFNTLTLLLRVSSELARLRAIEKAARELMDYSQVYKGGKYVRHIRADAGAWEALKAALGK